MPERKRRKMTKPKKKLALYAFLVGTVCGLFIPWIISFARSGSPYSLLQVMSVQEEENGSRFVAEKNVPYTVSVDFGEVLLDQAQREKKLIILSQNATVPFQAEKEGLFGWSIYAQTKSMLFHGIATYSVDLAEIKDSDIKVDPVSQIIKIYIPEPVLSIEYLPEQTEFLNTSNGILRFGEMEITPEMMTELETIAKDELQKNIEADETSINTARKFAALSVKEIFEPVLRKQIDAAVKAENDEYAVAPYYSIQVIVGEEEELETDTELMS